LVVYSVAQVGGAVENLYTQNWRLGVRVCERGGRLEKVAAMSSHASTRTTQLYYRWRDHMSINEVERIVV
jgi:hypothetical protein